MQIDRALVLGTGMMGPGIAATLALGGVETTLSGRTAESAARGLAAAGDMLRQLVGYGLLEEDAARRASTLLRAEAGHEAARDAQLIVESTPEDLTWKQQLLAALETLAAADTVLASNTSGLSITAIASACRRPERVVTTHFWNPPHLMPLVEVVRGERTAPEVAAAMMDLWTRCGKTPVLVKKDRPGQLGNRLQMALFREAVHIVAEGIAEAGDVDLAARLTFGIRLPVYGVLEHMDMVGLEMARAVCDYAARDLNNEPRAPRLFDEKIARGETGVRAGRGFYDWTLRDAAAVRQRRDRFIAACLKMGVARD